MLGETVGNEEAGCNVGIFEEGLEVGAGEDGDLVGELVKELAGTSDDGFELGAKVAG